MTQLDQGAEPEIMWIWNQIDLESSPHQKKGGFELESIAIGEILPHCPLFAFITSRSSG
jgi:hypothetical protein